MWYRFTCDAGPGHQSHFEEYKFYKAKPSRLALRDQWELFFERCQDPVGKAVRVRALPAKVRDAKIGKYEAMRAHATEMLEILRTVPKKRRS